jgi:uncharacterized protein YggE
MRYAVSFFVGGVGLLVALFIFGVGLPWQTITWGRIITSQPNTITVVGTAERQETNQLASFSAGVEAANLDKQVALTQVQQLMDTLIADVKLAGIPEADIKTQNVSVWQSQDPVPAINGRVSTKPGEWRVNNTIEVTVRDATKTEQIQQVLNNSGATNVYGPSYRTDDSQTGEDLLAMAVANAREKADQVAAAQGMKVVKVLNITEGGSTGGVVVPYAMEAKGMGGGPILPGTSTISSSAVVVFEIR